MPARSTIGSSKHCSVRHRRVSTGIFARESISDMTKDWVTLAPIISDKCCLTSTSLNQVMSIRLRRFGVLSRLDGTPLMDRIATNAVPGHLWHHNRRAWSQLNSLFEQRGLVTVDHVAQRSQRQYGRRHEDDHWSERPCSGACRQCSGDQASSTAGFQHTGPPHSNRSGTSPRQRPAPRYVSENVAASGEVTASCHSRPSPLSRAHALARLAV